MLQLRNAGCESFRSGPTQRLEWPEDTYRWQQIELDETVVSVVMSVVAVNLKISVEPAGAYFHLILICAVLPVDIIIQSLHF